MPFLGLAYLICAVTIMLDRSLFLKHNIERFSTMKTRQSSKLHLGCSTQVVNGWCNIDYAVGARLSKSSIFRKLNKKLHLFNINWDPTIFIHDLRKPLLFQDNSCEIIYSSNTLEHFSKQDGANLLRECFRVLMPSGIIRIVVPDLKPIVQRYINGEILAYDLVDALLMVCDDDNGLLKKIKSLLTSFPHKCMYDNIALIEALHSVGFIAKEKQPFDSEISDIQEIELQSRMGNAVIVEGVKE